MSAHVMAATERAHEMAATTKYCSDTIVVPDPKHVTVISDSSNAAAAASESINITMTVLFKDYENLKIIKI